jgi:hypothetical protein
MLLLGWGYSSVKHVLNGCKALGSVPSTAINKGINKMLTAYTQPKPLITTDRIERTSLMSARH